MLGIGSNYSTLRLSLMPASQRQHQYQLHLLSKAQKGLKSGDG